MRKRIFAISAVATAAVVSPAVASPERTGTGPRIARRQLQGASENEPCQSDPDCLNFACARKHADPSSSQVCCDSGDYFFTGPTLGNVCTWQEEGADCLNNRDELCLSDVCVAGKCMAEPLDDLLPCDNDSDCVSRMCGRRTADLDDAAEQVCCPGGVSLEIFLMGNVCGNQMDGMPCGGEDGLCENGDCTDGYCGGVRLPSNDTSSDNGENNNGSDSGSNEGGVGEKKNDETCGNDSECQSGSCVDSVCAATKEAGEDCRSASECINDVCGLRSLNNTDLVCCPSGIRYSAICTGQPNGARCLDPRSLPEERVPLDAVCESLYCCASCGFCKSRVDAGEPCQFDEDCIDRQCAENDSGERVCCPGGMTTSITGQCAVETSAADVGARGYTMGVSHLLHISTAVSVLLVMFDHV